MRKPRDLDEAEEELRAALADMRNVLLHPLEPIVKWLDKLIRHIR